MPYPQPTDDVAFFAEHGWIAVDRRGRSRPTSTMLEDRCEMILEKKESMAFDWAWEKGTAAGRARLQDRAVEPDAVLPRAERVERFRTWAVEFGSALMRQPLEFWYDQFLAKPPGNERADPLAPGRGVLGPQPRRARHHLLDAVARRRRGERLHALHRRRPQATACSSTASPTTCRATCCTASPTSAAVACPIPLGGVTFHHGKTPHMTPANRHRHMAPRPHPAPARRRAPRARATTTRGRSTSTSSRASAPLRKRAASNRTTSATMGLTASSCSCPVTTGRSPTSSPSPNVETFIAALEGALAHLGHEPAPDRQVPVDAGRRDRRAVGHRRPDDRRVLALGLRTAHHRRCRRPTISRCCSRRTSTAPGPASSVC